MEIDIKAEVEKIFKQKHMLDHTITYIENNENFQTIVREIVFSSPLFWSILLIIPSLVFMILWALCKF